MSLIDELISDFLKILKRPLNLRIIRFIKDTSKTQIEIAKKLNLSQSYTSQLLKNLENSQIIQSYKVKRIKKFKVKDNDIFNVIDTIKAYVIEKEKEKYNELFSPS
jgi:DNA-binding Lrp family transcriptional regulator